MNTSIIKLMDDMHLSSSNKFKEYYDQMSARNVLAANNIVTSNEDIQDQITESENVNKLINGVNKLEQKPKTDIDEYLSTLYGNLLSNINDTIFLGNYNNTTKYEKYNIVSYNNKIYFAKDNPPRGTNPTDNAYWAEFDINGLKGYGGISNLRYRGNWDSATNYNAYDVVVFKNKLWFSIDSNINYPPNLNHYPWNLIMAPAIPTKIPVQTYEPSVRSDGDLWMQIVKGEDIAQEYWDELQPETTPRFASGSFMIDDKIYTVGGQNAIIESTNTVEVYDTLTNTWSSVASYPIEIDALASFELYGKGYCAGGLSGVDLVNNAYSYDPSTNIWTAIANIPEPLTVVNGSKSYKKSNILSLINKNYSSNGITAEVKDGKITLNGTATANSFINIQIPKPLPTGNYMLSANNNQTVGSTTTTGSYACIRIMDSTAVSVIGTMAIFGNQFVNSAINVNTALNTFYFTIRTASGLSYDNFVIYPQLVEGNVAETVDKGYVLGGISSTGINQNIYEYDVSRDTWTIKTTIPEEIEGQGFNILNNKLYLMGGIDSLEEVYGYTYIYDLTTNTWSVGANMNYPRAYTGTFVYDNELYVVGGLDNLLYSTNLVEIYNPSSNTWRNGVPMLNRRNSLVTENTSKYGYAIGGIDIMLPDIGGYVERYTFKPEVYTFSMTIDTSLGNNTVTIPTVSGGTYSYTIDWGDNSNITPLITTYNDGNATHTYASSGTYVIKLNGSLSRLKFTGNIASCLISINSCKLTFDSIDNMFQNCINLNSIPSDIFARSLDITSANNVFENCAELKIIPTSLFSNNSKITTFEATFANSGIVTIPLGLFNSNLLATSFMQAFQNCSDLVVIPTSLFINNSLVTNFNSTFNNCTSVSFLPYNLFINNPLVTDYSYIYENCSNLSTLPSNLFGNGAVSVETFEAAFKNTNLTSIPDGIFEYASAATNYNEVFNGNSILEIPNNCFNGNNATYNNFIETMNIQHIGDNALNGLNLASNALQNLTNLVSIGNNSLWRSDNSSLTNMPTNMFNGCIRLESVGNISLKGVTESTNLNSMFSSCVSLINVYGFFDETNKPTLKHNISFADSPLNHNSLINISNSLVTLTSSMQKTLTLGNSNLAKLSDVEKLIIINKYWLLAGYTINVNAQIAQDLVFAMYGSPSLLAILNSETSNLYNVSLVNNVSQEVVGNYTVNKTTGIVTKI